MMQSLETLKLKNKIKTYIGFAKKSGNLKIGTDNILEYKKFSDIIISRDISDNTKNKIRNYALKKSSNLIEVDCDLFKFVFGSDKIKAVSILDKNLATSCFDCIKKLEESTVE